MFQWRFVVGALLAVLMSLGPSGVSSQNYPSKPIRIVTGVPGGGNDASARIIGPGISGLLGQPVIIDNRANIVIAETVAKAPHDGYTLLLTGDVLWVGPLLRDEKSRTEQLDPIGAFSPISMITTEPNILVVHPSLPVKSVQELIAFAKAKSGTVNYASGPAGTTNHLAAELFKFMAGVSITRIPYKGGGPAIIALLGGQEVQLYFGSPASVTSHIKSGKLRGLAVTSLKQSAVAPGLPTVAESGLPGYELAGINSMYAPAKTPAAIINQLNREIVRFLNTAEAREKYLLIGADVLANSPKEHAEKIKSQMNILGKVIKAAGITAD